MLYALPDMGLSQVKIQLVAGDHFSKNDCSPSCKPVFWKTQKRCIFWSQVCCIFLLESSLMYFYVGVKFGVVVVKF